MVSSTVAPDIDQQAVAQVWEQVRRRQPLVQCLTNIVAAPFTANVLLAAGAAPAMVDNPHEAGGFATLADAVLINMGTPYDDTTAAMHAAAAGAASAGTPWVLDPIGAGGLPWRTATAHELLVHRPSVIRGNASEVLGLAGGSGARGADSVDSAEDAVSVAGDLAQRHTTVVAVSGVVDQVSDGTHLVRVTNGHEWMTRVTGVGCALGALISACTAVAPSPLHGAVTATAALTVAAEDAAAATRGPGTFAAALLDELSALEPPHLAERVVLTWAP